MRSKHGPLQAVLGALAPVLVLVLVGCGHPMGESRDTIPPLSAAPGTDLGLGPGAYPLSFGPGDKGSPRVSPSGERVAFVLDGFAAEKPLRSRNLPRNASDDPGAEQAEWLPDESLAVLKSEDGTLPRDVTGAIPSPGVLSAGPTDGSSAPRNLLGEVLAAGAVPGGEAVVVAVAVAPATGSSDQQTRSRLMFVQGSEQPIQVYLRNIKGTVTGLSISPDGREAALAVRHETDDPEARFGVYTYGLSEGRPRRVARLPKGEEILGAPQWTSRGIHFVAGEADDPAAPNAPTPRFLYRVPEGSDAPEPVRGVGEDFVAASISVSPGGNRLAVVGRRNPGSPTNLYVLDLASETLEAATTNKNMEIKTNPRDLAWSPDGQSVILVARGALSGPEVYDAAANTLASAFYNLYEVPVMELPVEEEPEG